MGLQVPCAFKSWLEEFFHTADECVIFHCVVVFHS